MSLRKAWGRTVLLAALLCAPAFSEQKYVTRFDAFAGYAYLNSPAISLPEHGVQFQFGVRARKWLSIGVDYSNARGDLTLDAGMLTKDLQQSLGARLGQLVAAGVIPPSYTLVVPAHSKTQTFAAGPQIAFRHFEKVTIFVRPSCGLMREVAIPRPRDPVATQITAQLAPGGEKKDTTPFYGVGGGVDLNFTKHLSLRVQGDVVYDHLFDDLLRNGRRTFRFGIGPSFNFGKKIDK